MRYWIMDYSDHSIKVDGKAIVGWAALVDSGGPADSPVGGLIALGHPEDLARLVEKLNRP